jgi:hypothetical protein
MKAAKQTIIFNIRYSFHLGGWVFHGSNFRQLLLIIEECKCSPKAKRMDKGCMIEIEATIACAMLRRCSELRLRKSEVLQKLWGCCLYQR